MRFYTKQHRYYCGIDLHARRMYICILRRRSAARLRAARAPGPLDRLVRLRVDRLPTKPVSRPASRVGDSENLHTAVCLSEHNEERISAQQVSARVGEVRRPLARCLLDSLNCQVEFGHERLGRLGVPRLVPLSCGTGFRHCLGMNPCSLGWHYRPRIIRRASAQGTGATAPESSS